MDYATPDFLSRIPAQKLNTPDELSARMSKLAAESAFELKVIGQSSQGKDILALHLKGAGRSLVAWGFPHPDEPVGGTALIALAETIAEHGMPRELADAELWLVACADPDQAEFNSGWIKDPSLTNYIEQNWRPLYSGLEVDYHFPINHPPFYQPEDRSLSDLPKPLPESVALSRLLKEANPALLGLLHSNHVSGVYSYLSHRPSPEAIEAYDLLSGSLGLERHLGERPDPGRRWKTLRPDFLKEPSLAERQRKAEQQFGSLRGKSLVGCVSAGQYLESLDSQAIVLTPEVGLWSPQGIEDTSQSEEKRQLKKVVSSGRERLYGILQMADGKKQEVCYHTRKSQEVDGQQEVTMPLSRGMAGVEAVELRRNLLQASDLIWAQAESKLKDQDSPWLRERRAIGVSGQRVNDKSMLIFRADPAYLRPASKAQATDLKLRWGMQSCLWLGHNLLLYKEHGLADEAEAQAELLEKARKRLLGDLPEQITEPTLLVKSQIGRMLLSYKQG